MTRMNRQWLLRRRPTGNVHREDFEYRETSIDESAPLAPGEILVRNEVFLCAPTMRNWMEPPGNSLYPSIAIGDTIMAPAAGRVVKSARDDVPPGCRIMATTSWQDYHRIGPAAVVTRIRDDVSYTEAMGIYGVNARTAYFGLLRIGRARAGETLVVSGAAGSTGSTAAQIGRILGCRVIGIAGGPEKCRWLTDVCGLDAAIDYRRGGVAEQLAELCPNGIDIFFDNVGGEMLQAAVDNMARFGRIVLCGQIASYTADGPAPGPSNMMRLIYGSITMQGFLQGNYADEIDAAVAQLQQWVREGRIIHREDVRPGFEGLPNTFGALFTGSNSGTLLVPIT